MADPLTVIIGKSVGPIAGRGAFALLGRVAFRFRVARAVVKKAQEPGLNLSRKRLRRSISRVAMHAELLDSASSEYPLFRAAVVKASDNALSADQIERLVGLLAAEFVRRLPAVDSGRTHTSFETAAVRNDLRDFRDSAIRTQAPVVNAWEWGVSAIDNLHLIPRRAGLIRREDLETACSQVLLTGQLLVLHGPQGAGKSLAAGQLAFGSEAKVRWWIDGRSRASLQRGVGSMLRSLGQLNGPRVEEDLRRVLAEQDSFFLVVDNVTDPTALNALVPQELKATVVATTTNPLVGDPSSRVFVGGLTPPQGIELFRLHAQSLSGDATFDDDIETVVRALGSSPLAVRQAAAYAEVTGLSPGDLRKRLLRSPLGVLSDHAPADYPATIARVHQLARQSVTEREPAAAGVLALVALSGEGGITRQLLSVCSKSEGDEMHVDHSIAALVRAGIVHVSGGVVSCHALTASLENELAHSGKRRRLCRRALRQTGALISQGLLEDIDVVAYVVPALVAGAKFHWRVGYYYYLVSLVSSRENGSPQTAIAAAQSFREFVSLRNPNDPVLLELLLVEAESLTKLGLLNPALDKALAAAAQAERLGDTTRRTDALGLAAFCQSELGNRREAVRLSGLAVSSVPEEDQDRREAVLRFSLQIEAMGAEPRAQAASMLELREVAETNSAEWAFLGALAGRALTSVGSSDDALELTKESFAVDCKLFGESSLPAARDMNDIGRIYVDLGNLSEATRWLEKSRLVYADNGDHPHMAIPLLHLGRIALIRAERSTVDEKASLTAEAMQFFLASERADPAAANGESSAASLVARGDALLLSELVEDHREALSHFLRAVAADTREFGEDHTEVVIDLLRVTWAYVALQDIETASQTLSKIDEIFARGIGEVERRIETLGMHSIVEMSRTNPDSSKLLGFAAELRRLANDPDLPPSARAAAAKFVHDASGTDGEASVPRNTEPGASFRRPPSQ